MSSQTAASQARRFCTNCGTPLTARFCIKCGADSGEAAAHPNAIAISPNHAPPLQKPPVGKTQPNMGSSSPPVQKPPSVRSNPAARNSSNVPPSSVHDPLAGWTPSAASQPPTHTPVSRAPTPTVGNSSNVPLPSIHDPLSGWSRSTPSQPPTPVSQMASLPSGGLQNSNLPPMKAAAPNVDHARKRGVVIAVFLAVPLAFILFLGVRSAQQKAAQKSQIEQVQRQQQQAAQLADRERQRQYYRNQLTQNLEERRRFEQQYAAPSNDGYMAGQDRAAQQGIDERKSELITAIQQWCSGHSQGAYSYSLYSCTMTSDSHASFSVVGRNNESRADAMLDGGAKGMMPGMTYLGTAVYGSSGWSVNVMGL